MKIYIIDQELAPAKGTAASAGIDLKARLDTLIKSGQEARVPCNVVIDYTHDASVRPAPDSLVAIVSARSSLFRNTGCIMTNGIGIIDPDFCGREDEIQMSLYNTGAEDVIIKRGDRIGQILLMHNRLAKIEYLDNADNPNNRNRGGFGSTGGYSK